MNKIGNNPSYALQANLTEESKITGFGPFRKQIKNISLSLSQKENDSVRLFKEVPHLPILSHFKPIKDWYEKQFTIIFVKDKTDESKQLQLYVKVNDLADKIGLTKRCLDELLKTREATDIIIEKRPNLLGKFSDLINNTVTNKPLTFDSSLIAIKNFIKDETKFKRIIADIPNWNQTMVATIVDLGEKIQNRIIQDGANTYIKSIKSTTVNAEGKKEKATYAYIVGKDGKIYVVQEQIGKGSYKKVSNAVELTEQRQVVRAAIKEKKEEKHTQACIEKSLEINSKLKADHIVPPYELDINTETKPQSGREYKKVAIQTKFDGTCKGLAEKNVSVYHLLTISLHIAKGLRHIHDLGYIHSDIKPDNILVKGDVSNPKQPIEAFVSDFDTLTTPGHFIGGSPAYFAPELARNLGDQEGEDEVTSEKIDSYAFGVMIMEMLTGSYYLNNEVFAYAKPNEIDAFIESKKLKHSQSPEDQIRNALFDLTKQLLDPDMNNRLSCSDAVKKLEKLSQTYPFPIAA